jgi:hypothetical protein
MKILEDINQPYRVGRDMGVTLYSSSFSNGKGKRVGRSRTIWPNGIKEQMIGSGRGLIIVHSPIHF